MVFYIQRALLGWSRMIFGFQEDVFFQIEPLTSLIGITLLWSGCADQIRLE